MPVPAMRGANSHAAPQAGTPEDDEDDELLDLTAPLVLHSKRTERLRKRQQQKKLAKDSLGPATTLLDLPGELLLEILSRLRPSDIFRLGRTSKPVRNFIQTSQRSLAKRIIQARYSCLQKCFRLPVLLSEVAAAARSALQSEEHLGVMTIHRRPFQHVKPPDPSMICTCLTCTLRWNSLCLVVDFAHWQPNLEKGEPIPIIPRGRFPAWNQDLIAENAATVRRAFRDPLWYALILEVHLASTMRAIRRHGQNKGNKRQRFRMTAEDERSETDAFLERSGPPTLDLPYHRDNYYMLEAYLPNRGWNAEEGRWMYVPGEQHDGDVKAVLRRLQMMRLARKAENQSITAKAYGQEK